MLTSMQRAPESSERVTGDFQHFWEFYLSVHQDPWTRRFHAAATIIGTYCVLLAFPLTLDSRWLAAGPAAGYSLAWFSHLVFEHKPPAMLSHPLWALMCDFRMVRMMFQGTLELEARRIRATAAR